MIDSSACTLLWPFLTISIAAYMINLFAVRLPRQLERAWAEESHEILKLPYTTPKHPPYSGARQHCLTCHKTLPWYYALPVIGKLMCRQCPHCQATTPIAATCIDILTIVTSTLVMLHYGFSAQMLMALMFTWLLITLLFIDASHQLLPDQLTLLLLWLGLVLSTQTLYIPPTTAILGAAGGYLFFYLIALFFRLVTKKDGMGYGDFKMLAALGAWLGWQLLPMVVLTSALLATLYGSYHLLTRDSNKDPNFAFGPFLATAGWLILLYGDVINQTYLNLLGIL